MQRLGDRLFNWASILEDGTRQQAERTIVNVKGD